MAFPWAGLFSAVSGIASLFGGKKKTENRVNYKQMVRDAEAAGFNPLTVLRNGGAAGYMQTAHPALSSGEVIGGALSQVGNFLADFDPYADQKKEQEARLVEAQIANLNASTGTMFPPRPGKPGSFNVPSWGAANVEQRPSGRAGTLSRDKGVELPASAGLPQTPTVEAPTVTNPWPTGSGLPVNPGVPDASAWEERYGEPGDWIGGVGTFLMDMGHWAYQGQEWLKRKTDEGRKKAYRAPKDPYDRKMYIPPAFYGGPSYR